MKMKFLTLPILVFLLSISCEQKKKDAVSESENDFEALFNGQDFSGWETWIGVPHMSVEVEGSTKDSEGNYTEALGLNNDPLQVFSITEVDGAPALHVSGQIYGSFATKEAYENYHYRMEVKWGDKKWAPREDLPKNAGLLYHGTGEFGAGLGVWKNSHECQIMEGMFGDSYRMGDTWCEIKATRPDPETRYSFDPKGDLIAFGSDESAGKICSKNPENEKPHGEWNTVEIICVGDTSIHIINGQVNMVNYNSKLVKSDGTKSSLTKGVIQLQSEGAEVFYRNMEIRKISEVPEEYKSYL